MGEDAPAQPVRRPPGEPDPAARKQYWLGIGLGMTPVIVAWLALGTGLRTGGGAITSDLSILTAVSYGALVLAAIVCLVLDKRRRLAYGLLTMVFVGPIVWSVGCIVLLSTVHTA
jgi:hypothetical protein